jgi:DNA-directed RNA polymerase subunit RPC12/RpoP
MEPKISTLQNKYVCSECKNENELDGGKNVGDIVECKFCGIEYEIAEMDENGNPVLILIEEEK